MLAFFVPEKLNANYSNQIMAQIVQIALGTLRPSVNQLNDVVEVQDDNVVLGTAYSTFNVQQVAGMTADEVNQILNSKVPDNAIGIAKYHIRLVLVSADRTGLANSLVPKADKVTILNKAIYNG